MILSVEEFDNSRSMTLVTGYEFVQDAEPQLGSARLYKRARDASTIALGTAHAVESGGELRSICGKMMQKTFGPWPPVMGQSLCGDCQEALT
jgi:hypothetical protein